MATNFCGHSSDTLSRSEKELQRIRRNIAEMIPVSYVWKTANEFKEQRHWLWNNVEENDYQIAGTDFKNTTRSLIYFRHERDAVYFALRWA